MLPSTAISVNDGSPPPSEIWVALCMHIEMFLISLCRDAVSNLHVNGDALQLSVQSPVSPLHANRGALQLSLHVNREARQLSMQNTDSALYANTEVPQLFATKCADAVGALARVYVRVL